MRSQPYCNDHVITVIRSLYFEGDDAFVKWFGELFPLRHNSDGSTSYEVPVPMVALVGMAVSHALIMSYKQCTNSIQLFAALHEWRSGMQQVVKFSANTYLDVYLGHIGTLEHIQRKRESAFHAMMSDIYSQARYVCHLLILYGPNLSIWSAHQ